MVKAIKLVRIKNNRKHTTILKNKDCILHIDLIMNLFNRALNRGLCIEIDLIIDTMYYSKGYIDNGAYIEGELININNK